jgi:sucrose phosphorylase
LRNGTQLIVYADRFGGDGLATLQGLLTGPLEGLFTGVHILPFFTPYDGADAGFDPADHRMVDPRLGDWSAIEAISRTHDVTADLIVNHISIESPQFVDFVAKGDSSRYAGMFLQVDDVFPGGITDEALKRIYRPRLARPFTEVALSDGSTRLMWTTFSSEQIDLDVFDAEARAYLGETLDLLAASGVSQVRMDAVGYSVKTPGTNCFMTPETFRFVAAMTEGVRRRGMESLLEIHAHHADQIEAATIADRVYDFALPPLVLHALYSGDAVPLRGWLEASPRNAITVLDTHDGIGVMDVGAAGDRPGLLKPDQIHALVEGIHAASGGESRRATGRAASNLDLYQVNCSYFSALGGDENRYLMARLIQLLSPGIPQIYYAGLLTARNDITLLQRTGVGRDINRPYFDLTQIHDALDQPVVRRLIAMVRFRNQHPAFQGSFRLLDGASNELRILWENGGSFVEARIDVEAGSFALDKDGEVMSDWDEL